MAMVHRERERHLMDWPPLAWPERLMWPERWRRFLDLDGEQQWLRVEEFQEGDTLVVKAELPGIDPDKDVEVTAEGRVVTIRAHREEAEEHKGKRGYRSEFRYGEFEREIELPEGADPKDVTANYTDGILEVHVPCPATAAAGPTPIPVSHS